MKKNYTLKSKFVKHTMLWCGLLLASTYGFAQTLNFTIDTAVDSGVDIKETINAGGDAYVLLIDHLQNVEELDNLGGGDLIFYLGSGSSSTPFELTITKNGMPTNFNLNGIDYDTLGAGTISVTNQDGDFISSPTAYPLGNGTISITNASNALSITQININPGDANDLNDFGFHNISVDILDTLSIDEVSSLEESIEVFPNPSNGIITIKNSGIALNKVEVSDINGRAITAIDLEGTIVNRALDLKSVLSSGMYFMTISSDDASTVKKIIIE